MKKVSFGIIIVLGFFISAIVQADELIINSNTSDPAPRKAFTLIVEDFKKENPDIEVKLNIYDHEFYKVSIHNWLSGRAPDIVFWVAGESMKTFVDKDLFVNVSDVWKENNLYSKFRSTVSQITFSNNQYAIPYTRYHWGFYYNKSIFAAYNLTKPKSWPEFIKLGKTLINNGIIPITIGTKYLWPAAAWFEYLNLRINGLQFHRNVLAGKVTYADEKIRNVFKVWKEIIDANFFIQNHSSYSWQEAQPFLYQGKAAMYLIGNFITPNFPPDGNFGFFRFPVIDSNLPVFEVVPTEIIAIPAKSKNINNAKRFLSFIAKSESQTKINNVLSQFPCNSEASLKEDPYLKEGLLILKTSQGLTQFYDKDSNLQMARIGMKGFQEFMNHPENLDKILNQIEKSRKLIFKKSLSRSEH